MRAIFSLLRKDYLIFTKYKASVVITFVVPVVLIYIFGFVFGLNRKDSGPEGIPLVVVNQSKSPAAAKLVEALKEEKVLSVITRSGDGPKGHELTEAEVREGIRNNDYRFALIIPEDLVNTHEIGIHLRYLTNPRNEIESQTVNGLVQKTVFSKVPQLLGQSMIASAREAIGNDRFKAFNKDIASTVSKTWNVDQEKVQKRLDDGDYFDFDKTMEETAAADRKEKDPSLRRLDQPSASTVSTTAGTSNPAPSHKAADAATKSDSSGTGTKVADDKAKEDKDLFSKIIRIDNEQLVGKDVRNPAAARLIGGYAVMFLLFAVSGFSSSFFGEKSSGIFSRILATTATRNDIILSKFLFCILLGMAQILILFVFGDLIYHLDLYRHLLPLLLVSLCVATACASFGMLIAAVSSNPHSANGLSTFLVLTMSAIGGAWFPVSFMPGFIQVISKFTLVYWSVEGMVNIFWADFGLVQCLPTIGALLAMAVLAQGFALWRFNRGNLFD